MGYKVFNHLEGSSSSSADKDLKWATVDNIVNQWLYGTLSQLVFQSILKPNNTAGEVWKAIQDLFHEHKETKALELDDKLCNITLGDSTIMNTTTGLNLSLTFSPTLVHQFQNATLSSMQLMTSPLNITM